ncbi:MAG: hypothetical protein KAH31_06435 [Candidatus Sabulitectum sp.]|nr:hypothetical protein [Candidatus Sabulitectum sp.]
MVNSINAPRASAIAFFCWSPGETGLSAGVYLCRLRSEYGHSELKTVYSGL